MQANIEQHKQFHDGFDALDTYFRNVRKDPSSYDGIMVRTMIDQFGGVFVQHLHEEIGTLERSKLVAIFPNEGELKKIAEDMTNYNIKHASKLTSFPWVCVVATGFELNSQVITHHEEATCRGFMKDIPSAIVFVARYVLPWIYYRYTA